MVLIWYTKHAIPRTAGRLGFSTPGFDIYRILQTQPIASFHINRLGFSLCFFSKARSHFSTWRTRAMATRWSSLGGRRVPTPFFWWYIYIYFFFIYILWILKCLIILHPGSIVSHAFHSCLSRGIQRSLDGPRGGLAHSVCCEGKKALRPGHSSHRRGISIGGSSTSSIQVHCCGHPIQLHLWSIRYQCWTSFDNICIYIYIYECK